MKKILLFLFSFSFLTFSQNISPSLQSKISQIKTKEYIPVIIELNEKIDLHQLKVDFEIEKIKIKDRASILAKKLQNKYKKSQEELLKKLVEGEVLSEDFDVEEMLNKTQMGGLVETEAPQQAATTENE